jgi:hypothetical protein
MADTNLFGDPQAMALFGLSQGLLSAGSPQTRPVGLGGALAQGFGGALNNAVVAQKMNQQQALVDLEKLKAQQLQYHLGLQAWALGGGPMPSMPPMGTPAAPAAPVQPGAMPEGAPGMQPVSMGQPSMGVPQPASPQPMTSGPLAGLSPDAQQAIRLNIGLPGAGAIAMKDKEPIVGREGGIFKRNPDGSMSLDPGWLAGERQRLQLQRGIEDQHTIVDVPMADGRVQKMTKAQALNLTGATNEITNAVPGLNAEAVSSIQRQLLAEPDKPVDIDLNIGGRQAKLTLQPIGGRVSLRDKPPKQGRRRRSPGRMLVMFKARSTQKPLVLFSPERSWGKCVVLPVTSRLAK